MKKRFRSSLSLLSAVCITSISLYGCSSGNNTDPNSTGNSQSPNVSASNVKKPEKVYVYTGVRQPSKPESVEEVRQYILEKSGIEVIGIIPPKGNEAEKLNILLASGEPLDLFSGTTSDFRNKGAIQPINGLLDKYGANIRKLWHPEWDSAWKAASTPDGKVWGLPQVPPTAGYPVYIRTDWLQKVNLPMPKTIDELEQVLKAFKEKDPAGEGKTIPLLTDLGTMNNALAAGFMDIGYGNWQDADGKLKPYVLNPGYKDFVAKMADWYQKGYIYKEAFTTKGDKQIELVKQNRVAAAALWNSAVNANQYATQQIDPAANYDVAAELRGPKGFVSTMGGVSNQSFMLSKNSQNPEAAIKYVNWLDSDIENYLTAFYGIKGKHWKYKDEKNRVIELMNHDYNGDLMTALNFAYTIQFRVDDPTLSKHLDYIEKYITNASWTKTAADAEVSYKYDTKEISSQLPMKADLERLISEGITKFIMGARPMSDYDNFMKELNKAGMDKWIEVYTNQYNTAKSK